MAFVSKSLLLVSVLALAAAQAPCTCLNVGHAPECTGAVSGVVFTITCTIPDQNSNSIFFAAQGLTATSANPGWSSPTNVFSRDRQPDANGFQSPDCTNPSTPKFFAPNDQGWTYSYDDNTCTVTAQLQFGPNNLPSNFLFDNETEAASVSAIPDYNVITVPIGIGITTQISSSQVIVANTLFTFYARLPRALEADATRYALKLFKLSDNNREADLAFSAIVMGGLTSGPNRHVLENAVFLPDDGSPALDCAVAAEIYVNCGPFIDTNAPTPISLSGTLQVQAHCLDVDCIPRTLSLRVAFLAGDYETTITGNWTQLNPLIWRRLNNNDTDDVELTNDVIVAGDKLILSVHFDDGSQSTLTKLFLTVNGFSGAGASLVEYNNGNLNNVFVIEDTNPAHEVHLASTIYNQLQQSEIDSFFRFPPEDLINFAVEWPWPSDLPLDFRGQVQITSFFDITYAVRRRQGSSDKLLLMQAPQGSVGSASDSPITVVLGDSASQLSTGLLCLFLVLSAIYML